MSEPLTAQRELEILESLRSMAAEIDRLRALGDALANAAEGYAVARAGTTGWIPAYLRDALAAWREARQ